MDIPEYTFKEIGYSGSLQDIANILEYPQEQVLFSGLSVIIAPVNTGHRTHTYSIVNYSSNKFYSVITRK